MPVRKTRGTSEVDCQADPSAPWTAQVAALAHRLRAVLENHPGIAAPLKARDPIGPASLTLAEAFLAPMYAAGLPVRQAALAFRLVYDYTAGFALADPTSPAERRPRDTATRQELHAFLCSLPASRFPTLAAYGTHAWANDRDQRSVRAWTLSSAACTQVRADAAGANVPSRERSAPARSSRARRASQPKHPDH